MPHAIEVHRQVTKKARELKGSDKPLIAVFDLDSTLFNVSHRNQKILRDFSKLAEAREKYPEECKQLETVTAHHKEWGIRQSLIRSGVKAPLDFFEALRNFWREQFFSNHYLNIDEPYEGAVEYVQSIAAAGAKVMYLTGRDRPRMGEGTLKSLRQWQFPLVDPEHDLIMKPNTATFDSAFKKDVLIEFEPHDRQIWFFENEPVIINEVMEHCPHIHVVFLDSVHSGKQDPPDDIYKIDMRYRISDK